MRKETFEEAFSEKDRDKIKLSGKTFAIAVVDKAERVFSDIIIESIPKELQHDHYEIHSMLKRHRTRLIEDLNNYL